MSAILPDVNQLIGLTQKLGEFASHIGNQATNSVELIDGSLSKLEQLIQAKREEAERQHANIEANLRTEVSTLENLQNELVDIRGAFAELPDANPVELEAKAA